MCAEQQVQDLGATAPHDAADNIQIADLSSMQRDVVRNVAVDIGHALCADG